MAPRAGGVGAAGAQAARLRRRRFARFSGTCTTAPSHALVGKRAFALTRHTPKHKNKKSYLAAEDAPPAEGGGAPSLEHQESLRSLYIAEPIITLVDGLLRGEHNIAHALAHGDFGLGTLNNLDGEVCFFGREEQ